MRTIDQIIQRKEMGIDCTIEESAHFKKWIKKHKFGIPEEVNTMDHLCSLFPIECMEVMGEA